MALKNTANSFIDLVVAGPDFSGTTTQIGDITNYLKSKNLRVRDLRGNETEALFHADMFSDFNKDYSSLMEFTLSDTTDAPLRDKFLFQAYCRLTGLNSNLDLMVASMVKNDSTTYIDPDSADVWILEEPTRRGAGQMNRVIEQNRSKFGSHMDAYSAALTHQAYRIDEFLRFRKPMRDAGKIILRSRSEESACYQIYDEKYLPHGIGLNDYLKLPGHKVAFENPPTHIFVVCGPENWDKEAYLNLKAERKGRRVLDDHENDVSYQLLVNKRYAGNWIDKLYMKASTMYGFQEPEIIRFNIYDSKEEIKNQMTAELKKILRTL
jgi:hypothetical protein